MRGMGSRWIRMSWRGGDDDVYIWGGKNWGIDEYMHG
jgi:hypothetical protein